MEELSLRIKQKRGGRGIREVAREIGVSPATLSRIETGKQPDICTFKAICKWLHVDPSSLLGMQTPSGVPNDMAASVQAHFRAHKAMSPETAQNLANLIMAVQKTAEQGL